MNTIKNLFDKITAELSSMKLKDPYVIGIRTGGIWVAEEVHQSLESKTPLGLIDISFHRDDFDRVGLHPEIKSSDLPCPIDNRTIVLVDDVLHTGRTIRAAMNEIFSYGRPDAIILVVLIDRDERELPITADVIGQVLKAPKSQQVKLCKADGELQLKMITHKSVNI